MNNSIPLYVKTKEAIKQKIDEKVYKPGSMLPTESELCDVFQVSRVTIRKAISELLNEGVLIRGYGRRLMVKNVVLSRGIGNELNSLQEELEQRGKKCFSYILTYEVEDISPELAEAMDLPKDSKVIHIERLRYADDIPLCYQKLYLNYELCSELDEKRIRTESLYSMLKNDLNVKICKAEQSVTATMASYKVAAMLELPHTESLILITRRGYTDKEVCFEYSETQYVASRYSLTMTLWR